MIDLHMHTFFSDGELIPSELVRRAEAVGYRALAITDHVDESNYDFVAERMGRFADTMTGGAVTVLPGGELTHVPPARIGGLVARCRAAGMKMVVVHGETIVEPVPPGTNRAAIEARVDILAHPGLITDEEAALAARYGVALEISGRGGHSFTNGHVLKMARTHGATLVFNTDTHAPRDLMGREMAARVAKGCGMTDDEVAALFAASAALVARATT
ncbi:MAG: histidinol phosphate phosphatase domain-containing protein [Nitrospinae bacterium]|nr:histidinol phosphate phosphatase domain-containing protein [Nitrospinota bacterium]